MCGLKKASETHGPELLRVACEHDARLRAGETERHEC